VKLADPFGKSARRWTLRAVVLGRTIGLGRTVGLVQLRAEPLEMDGIERRSIRPAVISPREHI